MTKKPARRVEQLEVYYDEVHWQNLETLRSKAIQIIEILEKSNLPATTHGSVARGDVTAKSDVDIFVRNPPSSFAIEAALEREGASLNRRFVTQATPYYAVKGYIEVDEGQAVSFPLVRMHRVEREFYQFSGEVNLEALKEHKRVPGVDKRLMLIEPTDKGHNESSIATREEEAARLLGVSAETVLDRVHALLRRDRVGRTGVFIKRELSQDETFEMALKRLSETRPEVRRRLKF